MRLGEVVKREVCRKIEGYKILSPPKLKKLDVFQAYGVLVMSKGFVVVRGRDYIKVTKFPKVSEEVILDKSSLERKIREMNVKYPLIIVDTRYESMHTDRELRKLRVQLNQSLHVVRKFMWDEMLIVTSSSERYCKGRVAVFTPYGEKVYSGEYYDTVVIGGIVDKCVRKEGLSLKLAEEIERAGVKVSRVRVELRGSVVGVPDRINQFIELLLLCMVDGMSVEEAIKAVQPRIVARWRLRRELPKYVEKRNGERVVSKEAFSELSSWLNITWSDFEKVAREQQVRIV